MGLLDRLLRGTAGRGPEPPWTLLPVGRSTLADLEIRGNLGMQMVIRWAADQGRLDSPVWTVPLGALYRPAPRLQVFMPRLPLPRFPEAFAALRQAGIPQSRIILLATDLRLPLGYGRLRLSGEGSHPMVRLLLDQLGTRRQARLVFGLGPLDAPGEALLEQRWSEAEWARLADLEAPFAQFLARLEGTRSLPDLAAEVNDLAFWQGAGS